jgi:hypothetical protein
LSRQAGDTAGDGDTTTRPLVENSVGIHVLKDFSGAHLPAHEIPGFVGADSGAFPPPFTEKTVGLRFTVAYLYRFPGTDGHAGAAAGAFFTRKE